MLLRSNHYGVGRAAHGGTPPSAARAKLNSLGGVGFVWDYKNNSLCIVDPTTPANNYDGVAIGGPILSFGSPATGAHGGVVCTGADGYYMLFTAFGFSYTAGTMGCEIIRSSLASGSFTFSLGGPFTEHLMFRTGATPAQLRFTQSNVPGSILDVGSRIYVNRRANLVGTYSASEATFAHDGNSAYQADSEFYSAGPFSEPNAYLCYDNTTAELFSCWWVPGQKTRAQAIALSRPTDPLTWYVDSSTGSDADDGLTAGNAKLTLAELLDESQTEIRHGEYIKGKGRFFEILAATLPVSVSLSSTDPTAPMVIDGSRLIANGTWSADGTYPNVYKKTITHDTSVNAALFYPAIHYGNLIGRDRREQWSASSTTFNLVTGTKSFTVEAGKDFQVDDLVWIRNPTSRLLYAHGIVTAYAGTTLTVLVLSLGPSASGSYSAWTIRVTTELHYNSPGSVIVTNRAALLPGCFTLYNSGASDAVWVNGAAWVYHIMLPDSSNPASAPREIAYTEQLNILTVTNDITLDNIIIQRSSSKDMINAFFGNSMNYTIDCDFLDVGGHGIVCSPMTHTRGFVSGSQWGIYAAGGGFHFFRDEVSAGAAAACIAIDCTVIGIANGFYSHGTGGGFEQESVTLQGCTSVDCDSGISTGKATLGWHITNHTYVNCRFDATLNFPNDTEDAVHFNIVAAGDSMTSGYGVTSSFVSRLEVLIEASQSEDADTSNLGIPGASWNYHWSGEPYPPTLTEDISLRVVPALSTTLVNVVVLFAGLNGISLGGHSTATEYADLKTYITTLIAAAAAAHKNLSASNIYVLTMLPTNDFADATRIAYNDAIVGDDDTFGYTVVRIDQDASIGADGQNDNLTFYQADTIHPNDVGQAIIAELVYLAIYPPDTAIWSFSDRAIVVALSSHNQTATRSGATLGNGRAVRGTIAFSGKQYVEFYADTVLSSNGYQWGLGLATAAYDLNSSGGIGGAESLGYYNNGETYANNVLLDTITSIASTNLLRMSVDVPNKKIWIAVGAGDWNDNPAANPATNTGGLTLATITLTDWYPIFYTERDTNAVTIRSASADWTYAAPSGFGELA